MPDNKYIITKIGKTSSGTDVCDVVKIDAEKYNAKDSKLTLLASHKLKLGIGSIVDRDGIEARVSQKHHNCEPAVVLSADMISGEDINKSYKLVCAFSENYGDFRITLKTKNPFFYTKVGDEIVVYKEFENQEIQYKIATNKTADALRAKFLQQKQKQK